jgi:hypothetical protein
MGSKRPRSTGRKIEIERTTGIEALGRPVVPEGSGFVDEAFCPLKFIKKCLLKMFLAKYLVWSYRLENI